MPSLLGRYATPLTLGLFLVSLISGIALFFGVGQGTFHQMHEVLSMVLILPFVLHLWKNWRSLLNYFKRAPMALALAASLVAALAYAWPSVSGTGERGGRGAPVQFAFLRAVLNNPVSEVAPLLGQTPDALVTRLKGAGFAGADTGTSLTELAMSSGKGEGALIAALMAPAS